MTWPWLAPHCSSASSWPPWLTRGRQSARRNLAAVLALTSPCPPTGPAVGTRESRARPRTLGSASTVCTSAPCLNCCLSAGKQAVTSLVPTSASRDSCVYEKAGETDGSLYCFTYDKAVHYPVCEDPQYDGSLSSTSGLSTEDGFLPPVM